MIDSTTRSFVIRRASNRCEYCRLPQDAYVAPFNVDHIIATQHGSNDDESNLALSCPKCNRKKGPNIASVDPTTRAVISLFHPRHEPWAKHFRWDNLNIVGLTPQGRATVSLLDLNSVDRLRLRILLQQEGADFK